MKRKILISLCLMCLFSAGYGQQADKKPAGSETVPKIEKLIIDPKVRYGRLDNGMTYYIRHNRLPKERAEFYIVHNVGSMQEEEHQRGLAHFLEHMAFNGSRRFPSKTGIQDYTESIGMRMGENLNAYTGFDQTVYMLMNVPVTREGIIDSCLLILHDWSGFLLLADESVEKERGVIREEWRSRSSAQLRLWEQQLPKLFPNNRYGNRLPIGLIDVINGFKGNELRDYYNKWYRPDLQAIIIVGDIDIDRTEAKIKTMYADIPKPESETPVVETPVPDNPKPLISIARDREMTDMELGILYKHDILPEILRGTMADFLTNYSQAVVHQVMSERFSDILQKPNPPFISAYATDGNYLVAKTKGAWSSVATVKPDGISRGMNALVLETEKIRKFGITKAEYDRARTNILKQYESLYNERENQQNSSYAGEYIRHFTDGEYIPGIEAEYEIVKQFVPNLPVDGINHYIKNLFSSDSRGKNVVISLAGPDLPEIRYPSEDELLVMYYKAIEQNVTAGKEEFIRKELVGTLPQPGKIIEEKEDPKFGATLFTLSNGVRAVVKKTDCKKDEIMMTAKSPGGMSLFKDKKDTWNLKIINQAIETGGLGDLNASDLSKALAGKQLSLKMSLGDEAENINGVVSPSDLKTFFELIYLGFTGVRVDDDAYSSFAERARSQLANFALNPQIVFSDSISSALYGNNPRNNRIKSADFDKIDYHRMIDMYKERYGDASDFLFIFTGNIDKDTIRPFLKQYLATLPALNRIEKADESAVTPFRKGKIKCHFTRKMETPKTSASLVYSGNMPYNLKNAIVTQLLNRILEMLYNEKVREEESASYGVMSEAALYQFPRGRTSIQIVFDTDPEKKDKILNIVKTELQRIATEGPSEENLTKSRDNIIKSRAEAIQHNPYWLNLLDMYYYRNFDSHTDYESTLQAITVSDIRAFTKAFLDQGNELEVVMSPEQM
jgi:zinc protease